MSLLKAMKPTREDETCQSETKWDWVCQDVNEVDNENHSQKRFICINGTVRIKE